MIGWKVGVIGITAAVGVAIALTMATLGDDSSMPQSAETTLLIDIESGMVFRVKIGNGISIPARNPVTEKNTLFPVVHQLGATNVFDESVREEAREAGVTLPSQREPGYYVELRYLGPDPDLSGLEGKVDPDTGRLLVVPDRIEVLPAL